MGEVSNNYLDNYRKFFEHFAQTVDPNDQLPVKVAGYNLLETEIIGAVADWALQYLEERKCPPPLLAHLVRRVVEEVRVQSKVDPLSCGFRSETGDFLSLKLMQACVAKVVAVCSRYQDNAELSSLPPPHHLPLTTAFAVKNSRRSMEDRHVIIHDFHTMFNIKGYGPASYYGVFDGHNGTDAAVYSVSHLHQYLAESRHYPGNPALALREACKHTDDLFSMKAQRENLHGGTTAVFSLLRPKERKLYVAWLGDSQAVLVRHGVPWQIVKPHKPDRSDERDRIEGMGGTVIFWGAWRVNGQLAVSRAIGDVEYKPYVTAEPDVEEITLDGTEDFLILACDGLWDFVTEQEATNAVYSQLQESSEDLAAVSHRLVALAKEQSSQDNISVVVVFLRAPGEVASRMETETSAANNPFAVRNGADLFAHFDNHHDDEEVDFGPETDVDMVDDVLLSPTIAAAKKMVDDDLERQRQQLADFDDPTADMEGSRDTPTPPAHEVASNAIVDPLGDSGEESEEEWNYIPGQEPKPSDDQEQDDMSSQLNPDAAEFVPVSPTRMLMMDDAIISASGYDKSNTSLDDVDLPTETEFQGEIRHRPGDLEYTNGPKHVDYFMRDNFSTIQNNKGKDFRVPTTCTEVDSSILSFKTSLDNNSSDETPFDKLEVVKNIEEEKENLCGMNDFSNNFGAEGIFGKGDPMTTSVVGFTSSPELEAEDLVPGTPKSTTVEAPVSPSNDDVLPLDHQENLDDSPADDSAQHENKSSDLLSQEDGPHEGATLGQERISSSGFESESGAEESVPEDNDGFITEHRRSPPMELSFKPIQNFGDTNPFGALQTPGSTNTPMTLADNNMEVDTEQTTHVEEHGIPNRFTDNFDFVQNSPASFISVRSPTTNDVPPAFDKLESPTEELHFEAPPSANSSLLASELPKALEEELNLQENIQEPFETDKKSFSLQENLVEFETQESNTLQGEKEHEVKEDILREPTEFNEVSEDEKVSSTTDSIPVEKVLSAFDEFEPHEEKKESEFESETKEMKLEFESRIVPTENAPEEPKNDDEEFEVISKEEIKDVPNFMSSEFEPTDAGVKEIEGLLSPTRQTNPFAMNDDFSENLLDAQKEDSAATNDFLSAIDKFDSVVGETSCQTEQETMLASAPEVVSLVEPEATKTVSYQTLTPANEPSLSKTEMYVTGIEDSADEKIHSHEAIPSLETQLPAVDEAVVTKPECVENQAVIGAFVSLEDKKSEDQAISVTETLIRPVEEKCEVEALSATSAVAVEKSPTPTGETLTTPAEPQSVPAPEVLSSTETPPPTPAPGLEGKDEAQKTDILVAAAVAAAGVVAAGTAVVAEKEAKKTTAVSVKKATATAVKKTSEATAKAPAKSVPAKTPAAKPAVTKTTTTTKPSATSTATKPTSASGATKAPAAKPTSTLTAAKKPTPASPPKPSTTKPATKPAPATTASTKPVPKQLPVTKTTLTTLKSSSKPSTPSSKPTTPTTPKSPSVMKSDVVKSPPRPAVKSTVASSRPSSAPTRPSATSEKKPLTNGDIKPLTKKPEDATKKPATAAVKTTTTARPSPPVTKTSAPSTKAPATVASKTLAAKTTATAQPKPKAPTTTAPKATPAPIKRPVSAPATKPGEKIITKSAPNAKPAVNGKAAPAKPTAGVKKTDAKVNGKTNPGKPVPKKPEEVKVEEEQEIKIQEHSVTTTNGYAEHIVEENGTMKIEELATVLVDGVN